MKVKRLLEAEIKKQEGKMPAIAIIGARQVGKTTLSRVIMSGRKSVVFIDLEKSSDRLLISNTEAFLNLNKGKIIVIDEIQLQPNLFPEIRSFIDNNSDTKFLILGSSTPALLRQSSESLAGRIYYFELTPFLWQEIKGIITMQQYRLIGGMPLSVLAETTEDSFLWLRNYIATFLERDLRNFGFNIAPETIRRLWQMLAHLNGQLLNYSMLSNSMGVSHTSIRNYVDILSNTFMLRVIQPYHINTKKRLVKSPKVYFRDNGVLHALLKIESFEDLFSHPIYGSSWETTVIENIIAKYHNWDYAFYRTSNGSEIDLVLSKASRVIAIEIKSSSTPKLSRGFWTAIEDIKATESYVIAPVRMSFPLEKEVFVYPLEEFLEKKI
jgi:predicted AAA+ superfamily ATPase